MQKNDTNPVATKKSFKPLVSKTPVTEGKSSGKRQNPSTSNLRLKPGSLSENDKKYDQSRWELMRNLLHTVKAVRSGNFAVRMEINEEGIISEIGEVLNDIIELNQTMANEPYQVQRPAHSHALQTQGVLDVVDKALVWVVQRVVGGEKDV